MHDAGCEVAPTWADGAKLFVPFTPEQLDDLVVLGLELESHHILALYSDKRDIEEALTPVRRKDRPRVSAKHLADRELRTSAAASSSGSGSVPYTAIGDALMDDVVNDPVLDVVQAIRTDSSLDFPAYSYPADFGGALHR